MTTLKNVSESLEAIKRIFEIQQSIAIRDDKHYPIDTRKLTVEELSELFGLLYSTQDKLTIAERNLKFL